MRIPQPSGRTLSHIYRRDVSIRKRRHDVSRLTRIAILVNSQRSTRMLDEQVQDTNLAALKAFFDAALHFFGDEVTSLGSRGKRAAKGLARERSRCGETHKVFCHGIVYVL